MAQVDVFSGPAFFWARVTTNLLRLLDKKIILTLHGGGLPAYAERHPRRVAGLLSAATIVTTPSAFLLKRFLELRPDIKRIPNAINLKQYEFRLRANAEPRIIWLRAFHVVYNPILAVETIFRLKKLCPAIQLIMVGRDKGDGSLRAVSDYVAKNNLQANVVLKTGVPKSQVPEWMNKGDIFLNTSTIDNAPVSVIEAMACGLCVVTTNVGGIPYLLEHENDSLLVNADDPRGLADAITRILGDPDLAARLSQNARNKAEKFDWSVVLDKWDKLLSAQIS